MLAFLIQPYRYVKAQDEIATTALTKTFLNVHPSGGAQSPGGTCQPGGPYATCPDRSAHVPLRFR